MILDMAMGGSTNTVLHILAIAAEAEVPFTMKRIDELSQKTPEHLQGLAVELLPHRGRRPGRGHPHDPGRGRPGMPRPARPDVPTVTGKTLGENIAEYDVRGAIASAGAQLLTRVRPGGERTNQAWTVPSVAAEPRSQAAGLAVLDSEGEGLVEGPIGGDGDGPADDGFDPFDVIRPVDRAYSSTGGLAMLYGNLAPDGAVVKTAGVAPTMLRHSGPAVIFENEEDAYNGIVFGKVKAGDVVDHPQRRPQGGPGHAGDARADDRDQGGRPGRASAPWSPTAASPAAPPAPRSATSAPRPPSAAPSA